MSSYLLPPTYGLKKSLHLILPEMHSIAKTIKFWKDEIQVLNQPVNTVLSTFLLHASFTFCLLAIFAFRFLYLATKTTK